MKIHQNDLGDILNFLPDENIFNEDNNSEFIICSLGFEERTFSIVEKLVTKNSSNHKNLILVTYPTNKEDNKKLYVLCTNLLVQILLHVCNCPLIANRS